MKQTLINQIKADSIVAMKSGEKEKLSTLRLLVADLEKEKVQHKLSEITGLTEDQTISVINRSVKKLDKEIEAYVAVGRSTEKQEAEKELLISYLPVQASEEEIKLYVKTIAEITKSTGGNIGQAMKNVSAQLKGKADMKRVSELMKEEF